MPTGEHQSWLLMLSDTAYRRLLVCYPKAFRAAYGDEMSQVFRDQAREVYRGRGAAGLLALWVAALRDLAVAAAAERLVEERQMLRKRVTVATVLIVIGTIYVAIAFHSSLLPFVFDSVVYLPVFNLLIIVNGLVHSFALALVLVTLVFQLCLLPLTHRLLRDARALRDIQPELRPLREQYRGDLMAWQAARRDLYRAHGITTGGVALWLFLLWLFLQNIFLYPVYGALRTVLPRGANVPVESELAYINSNLYQFVPHVQTLPNTHCLWANLGAPDPLYILPVLSGLLTVLVVYLLLRHRSMLLATVVLLLLIVWDFPAGAAGIVLSWGVAMLFTVAVYVALARRVPGGERPRDHRLATGSAG
jgi:membrane protein insertase Oxa1/YidC/SpoIIIJ